MAKSINIFSDAPNKPGSNRKSRSKKNKTKVAERQRLADQEALGKAKLERLNPMVIPLLAAQEKQTAFIKSSMEVIQEHPHRLTDNWINKLNNWVDEMVAASILDEPDVVIGQRAAFGPLKIDRIIPPNLTSTYPMPAIMCKDDRGWKWYFKTSKAGQFSAGDYISFSATPSGHGEGITFLRRPTKLAKVVTLFGEDND